MGLPKLLTLIEAAEAVRTKVSTLRAWIYEGRLPGRRVGRRLLVDEADLLKFIEAGQVVGQDEASPTATSTEAAS